METVARAAAYGSNSVNFLPNHFFADQDGDLVPEYFCTKITYDRPGKPAECVPFTVETITTWRQMFQSCVQFAVNLDLDISVTPHLNDGLGRDVWRNALQFDPLRKYGGFSYLEIMLQPVADSLAATISDTTTVWFAMVGEMSRTVIQFPDSYHALIPYLQKAVAGEMPSRRPNVKVGVSFNYNKLCGMQVCTAASKSSFNSTALVNLLRASGFIGTSAYLDIYNGITRFDYPTLVIQSELSFLGVDLKDLVERRGIPFVYSEFGLGGGTRGLGDIPARTVGEAGLGYNGINGPYNRSLDPWDGYLPETVVSATRDFQRGWYRSVLSWLSQGGGPTFHMQDVYLWSLNSWDVQAVHPESTTADGSYYEPVTAALIRQHNAEVAAATGSVQAALA